MIVLTPPLDVLVWSNARVVKWVCKIGLEEYSECLKQQGVHGAVIALDDEYNAETLAIHLQIPNTNEKVRASRFIMSFLVFL